VSSAPQIASPTSGEPALARSDLGFLLAKASQRWNEHLADELHRRGFPEVRPSFGSVLVPLFDEDGLRMGELARRSRLAKQTMTTMVRLVERAGLVSRRADPADGRAVLVELTRRGRTLQPVATALVGQLEAQVVALLGKRRTAALRLALAEVAESWS
jgi:DNA-binding MarR family transcriptional regulator